MNAVFSSHFIEDLLEEETRYYSISDRLGSDLHERVKNTVRTIIRLEGGDYVGPHVSFLRDGLFYLPFTDPIHWGP